MCCLYIKKIINRLDKSLILCFLQVLFCLSVHTHLYLTNHVGQSFAAPVFTFNRFIHNTVSDDDENLGKVRVIRSKNDGIVAVGGNKH